MALKKEEREWRERLLAAGFKFCPSCGEIKTADEFNKSKAQRDGLNKVCRGCSKDASKMRNRHGSRRMKRRWRKELLSQGLKDCTKCGEVKPVEEFYKKASMPDGFRGWCKECESVYHSDYNRDEVNQEKIRVRKWSYRERNPEKVKAYERKYYWANRDRKLEYKRAWHQENREEQNAIARERALQWVKDNPERHRINQINRESREKGAEGSFTEGEWLELLKRCGHKCLSCGSLDDLTKDHIKPIVNGGSNYIDNIQPLCKSCNCAKGAHHEKDWRPDEVKRWAEKAGHKRRSRK